MVKILMQAYFSRLNLGSPKTRSRNVFLTQLASGASEEMAPWPKIHRLPLTCSLAWRLRMHVAKQRSSNFDSMQPFSVSALHGSVASSFLQLPRPAAPSSNFRCSACRVQAHSVGARHCGIHGVAQQACRQPALCKFQVEISTTRTGDAGDHSSRRLSIRSRSVDGADSADV